MKSVCFVPYGGGCRAAACGSFRASSARVPAARRVPVVACVLFCSVVRRASLRRLLSPFSVVACVGGFRAATVREVIA